MLAAMTLAVGVDVGTTNLKVVLIGHDGHTRAAATRALPVTRGAGTAEQDAEVLWQTLAGAVREIASGESVDTFAVCSQYSSIVAVDAQVRPLGPMLMWQDQRGTQESLAILGRHAEAFGAFVERHGIPPVGGGLSLAHILHLQHHEPELHARTAAYLEAMDYVTARATGRIAASQHTTYMYELCDNRRLGARHYDSELVGFAGVDPARLPPLVSVDEELGGLTEDATHELGLPESTVVYAGTNDTATVGVAAGVFRAGRAGLAIGTTSVLVDAVEDFRVDLEHQIFSMPGPYPDRYVVCAENGLGGKVLEHVLQNVVFAVDELADHSVPDPYSNLDAALASSRPGAGGVLFLPFLSGSLAPQGDPNMRGGFVNLSLMTNRGDLVRAVAEGVAHNARALLPWVERFTEEPVEEIVFVGGAARSKLCGQILADVLDRPVVAMERPELAAARAAALLGLQRSGSISRERLDAEPSTRAGHFEPDPDTRELFAARQGQFEAAYAALLPISEALHQ
jgi:xylulokinase